MILTLTGGVGGARLAQGLAALLGGEALGAVVNTGDDFEHMGLRICPDLDTVMYTLADLNDEDRGWGLRNETWTFMSAVSRFSDDTWFQLGDADLATHVLRTAALHRGESLTTATSRLCHRLGLGAKILPMSDDPVATMVVTDEGTLSFQSYFVARQWEPRIKKVYFDGVQAARPSSAVMALLSAPDLRAIVLAPSNPFVSIGPILAVPGIHDALMARHVPLVAVSPIIGGKAVKGPAAKMLVELGHNPSAASVAGLYGDLLDGFVIDTVDADMRCGLEERGLPTLVTDTMMTSLDKRKSLAERVVGFTDELGVPGGSM